VTTEGNQKANAEPKKALLGVPTVAVRKQQNREKTQDNSFQWVRGWWGTQRRSWFFWRLKKRAEPALEQNSALRAGRR